MAVQVPLPGGYSPVVTGSLLSFLILLKSFKQIWGNELSCVSYRFSSLSSITVSISLNMVLGALCSHTSWTECILPLDSKLPEERNYICLIWDCSLA